MQKINRLRSVCYAERFCTILSIIYSESSIHNYFGRMVNTWKVCVNTVGKVVTQHKSCLSKFFLLCTNIHFVAKFVVQNKVSICRS